MLVKVPSAGMELPETPIVLRRPGVSNWSEDEGKNVVGRIPAAGFPTVPGKVPSGLAGVGAPLKEGAVPPCSAIRLLFISTLPRYQSKPRARVSFCATSTNLALMFTWGGAMLRACTACSMMSRS